jgi:hypothetical protein
MDSSLEEAHNLVEGIWRGVFGLGGALDSSQYKDAYQALRVEREAENDIHEVYAYALERYRKRQAKNLTVTESDSDRLALVRRRRDYIAKLLAFHHEVSALDTYLRGRSSPA